MTALARRMRLSSVVLAALAAVSLAAQTALIEQGRAAINRGDSDAAIRILEKAVAQSPASAVVHGWIIGVNAKSHDCAHFH